MTIPSRATLDNVSADWLAVFYVELIYDLINTQVLQSTANIRDCATTGAISGAVNTLGSVYHCSETLERMYCNTPSHFQTARQKIDILIKLL